MRAKKSLGQNFLKSKKVISDMIRSADVHAGEHVLEIGPGKGVLTDALLIAGAKVVAVEADSRMIPILEERFVEYIKNGQLKIINADIFKIDLKTLFTKKPYKIVANIPYYITGAILRGFLESSCQPVSMTLLVQKEVAERIVAKDKKESILSISVKVYGQPKIISKVPKRYFTPEPKVDSAILLIEDIKNRFKSKEERGVFFNILRSGFAQKRKTLIKNLSQTGFSREKTLNFMVKNGLSDSVRAEDLSLENWLGLVSLFFTKRK